MATNFALNYPASAAAANPSVGVNGATAPASSTEVAGVNPSGNLQPISVDGSGNQNVNVVSSALPTGAATSANQQTEITALQAIQSNTNGVATAANQTSEIAQLTGINGKLTTTANGLKVDGSAVTQPVSGSVTVTQATGINLHAVIDSGTVAVSSLPSIPAGSNAIGSVSVSNFPASQPVSGTVTVTQATGTNLHTVIDSGSVAVTSLPALPAGSNAIGSVSVSNFPATQPVSGTVAVSSLPSIPAGANAIGSVTVTGVVTTSDAANGSVTAGTAATKSELTGGVYNTTLPTLTTGQQVATQLDSSGRQIIAPLTSASQVTIANASIATTQAASAGVANAPVYQTWTTGAPLSTTAYTQLIASTTAAATYIDIFDSSGNAIILATGASGSEVVLFYVPPGGDQIRVAVAAGTRLSVKALTAASTGGFTLLNLLK